MRIGRRTIIDEDLIMARVGRRRLRKLADYLRTVPPKVFDMNIWCKKKGCGTVACALGHAAQIPSFKRAGLHFEWFTHHRDEAIVRFGEFDGTEAAEAFFGITGALAYGLFGSRRGGHATAKQVARAIERACDASEAL